MINPLIRHQKQDTTINTFCFYRVKWPLGSYYKYSIGYFIKLWFALTNIFESHASIDTLSFDMYVMEVSKSNL